MVWVRGFFAFALVIGCAACAVSAPRGAVIPIDEPSAYGLFLAGRYASDVGDTQSAEAYFDAALNEDRSNPIIAEQAFISAAAAGDLARASRLARDLVHQPGVAGRARLVLAVSALKRGRYQSAITALDNAPMGAFDAAMATSVIAWAYEGLGRTDMAMDALDRNAENEVLAPFSHLGAALIHERNGNRDAAQLSYLRALPSGVVRFLAVDGYGRFLERSARTDEAAGLYRAHLVGYPDDAHALAGLRRIAAGERPLPMLATVQEGASVTVFGQVAIFVGRMDPEFAAFYLQLALYLDEGNGAARHVLGQVLSQAGRSELALEVLEDHPAGGRDAMQVQIQRAWLLADLGRRDDAVSVLRRATGRDEGDQARIALADLYAATGDEALAIAIYTDVLDRLGDAYERQHWVIFFARAGARRSIGDWRGVEDDLEAALALAPDQPTVMNVLGQTWVERGENLSMAFDLIQRSVALAPQAAEFVASLGRAHLHLGEYADAVIHLERAATLQPDDPQINDLLGDAYWHVGRRLESGFQWTRALHLDPPPDLRASLERKLQVGLVEPARRAH